MARRSFGLLLTAWVFCLKNLKKLTTRSNFFLIGFRIFFSISLKKNYTSKISNDHGTILIFSFKNLFFLQFSLFLSGILINNFILKIKDYVRLYELIGKMLGLALYNGFNVDVSFHNILFKLLLKDCQFTVNDLKYFDNSMYKSLCWIQ